MLLNSVRSHSVVLYEAQTQRWLHFHHPIAILTTTQPTEVLPLLAQVEQQVEQQGYYAAGFISYEAAPAFDPCLVVQPCPDFPLVWFGLYQAPEVVTLPPISDPHRSLDWQPSISRSQYQAAIARIKQAIAQGLTYQVNFSLRLQADFPEDPWPYFLQLIHAQAGQYGAYVDLADWAICCASPELFFQWQDGTVTCCPMKGTAPRGLNHAHDRQLAEELRRSVKNQAENLMIVDMIRNDLGRIAELGTVQVPSLFDLERYPTLWQMTSLVQCQTQARWSDLVAALFPCASITGAPKPSTMQIIADLEDSPRRIYTGTIGLLQPDRTAQFNVAIRTVLVNQRHQRAEYGVGGGIVWDSDEAAEFTECCTKAKILTQSQPVFELLESLLWTPETGYFLLDLHLQRLQQSALYFGFRVNSTEVIDRLDRIAQALPAVPHKVRLVVDCRGQITWQAIPLTDALSDRPLRVTLAATPIDASDIFLWHKTTHRTVYEQAKQAHPDCDDVLLWNQQGELTESCVANIVVEQEGQWYTPPVNCGLLAGTMRSWLLQQGTVQERIIRVEDLPHCSRIFLVNSVRQMQPAIVVPATQPSTLTP